MKYIKRIIIFCLLLIFSLSFKVLNAKENYNFRNGEIVTNDDVDISKCIISNYYIQQQETNIDDMLEENGDFFEYISINKKGKFSFKAFSSGNMLIIDLYSLPKGYGVDKKILYIKSDLDDVIFTLSKIDRVVRSDGDIKLFNEYGNQIFASLDYEDDFDNLDEFENNITNDTNELQSNFSQNERSYSDGVINFSDANASLYYIFDRTYQSSAYYNRFIICHDDLTSIQLQNIADTLYDIENYFTYELACQSPETYNGYLYVCCYDYEETDFGGTFSLSDINGHTTNKSFIILNEDVLSYNEDWNYKQTLAHEYSHCIQNLFYFFGNYNYSTWVRQSLAEAMSFIYSNNNSILSNQDMDSINNYFKNSIRNFASNSNLGVDYNSTTKTIFNSGELYDVNSFVFPLFIFNEYGGWSTIRKLLIRGASSTIVNALTLYVDTLNYDCNYSVSNFDYLYKEFCVFFLNASENYNVSSNWNSLFQYDKTEQINIMSDSHYFQNKTILPYSYAVYRFDHKSKAHLINTMTLEFSQNGYNYIPSNSLIVIERLNTTTGYKNISYHTINSELKIFNIEFGLNVYDAYVVMLISEDSNSFNCKLSYEAKYLPYDGAEYRICCDSNNNAKYMTIELDEFNCTTIYRNVFLYDYINNSIAQRFIIKSDNNGNYYILTKATSYYPEDFPNIRLSISNSNIETVCDGIGSYSLFNFYNINSCYFKIYKANASNNIVRTVNYLNGNNNLNQLTSNGNIIISTNYSNTYLEKWRFSPLEEGEI